MGSCASSADRRDPVKEELEQLKNSRVSQGDQECRPGHVGACFTGPDEAAGRGICQDGQHECSATGYWGPCKGQTLPKPLELCNDLDDDCNGVIDDGFPRMGTKCEVGIGECKAVGVYACRADGTAADCSVRPKDMSAEICDGKDNDCDGQIDEADTNGNGDWCDTRKPGACRAGRIKCVSGDTVCLPQKTATHEVCNRIDDDCDGLVDEDCVPG